MSAEAGGRPGARLADRMARVLAAQGADVLFGMPGGGPNLDMIGAGARHGLRFVLAHGETAGAIMASTYGLLRGVPAPVVATRGPGAASVTNGLAQATLDRYPMVAMTDTVPAATASRVAHQRLDQRAMLAPVAKVSATATDTTTDAELAELVASARRWPYGGIHLDLDPSAPNPTPPAVVGMEASTAAVTALDRAAMHRLMAGARRPLLIVGMEAAALAHRRGDGELARLLTGLGCPVLSTYQAVGVVPTENPLAAGIFTNGALERPVLDAADLIVTVGLDLVEPIPAPWPLEVPVLRLSATRQMEDYLPATVDVVADLEQAVAALSAAGAEAPPFDWDADAGARFRHEARRRLVPPDNGDAPTLGPLDLVAALARVRPEPVTVTVDAGAHFLSVMPNWAVTRPFELLISNGLATMGFAVPAAIGASLARPEERVLALTGDGGLAMVQAELETLARLALPVTVVVFNDAALSLIEIKQGSDHGGHEAVRYRPVDLAAIARAAGIDATVATTADDVVDAAGGDRAGGDAGPQLIDARIDPSSYAHLIEATRG